MRSSSIEVVFHLGRLQLRSSSIEVIFHCGCLPTTVLYVHLAQISSFGTFPGVGGLVKSKIKLISAEAEAKASSLSLSELGNNINANQMQI